MKPILGFQTFGDYPLAPPRKLGVSRKSIAKSGDVWPQIARLTDHPQKWACTFWNLLALTIPKSTGSFLWDVCEPSNSRLKSIDFSENTPKIHWFWRIWIQKKKTRNWPGAKGFFHFFLHNITFEDPLSQFLKKLLRHIKLFFCPINSPSWVHRVTEYMGHARLTLSVCFSSFLNRLSFLLLQPWENVQQQFYWNVSMKVHASLFYNKLGKKAPFGWVRGLSLKTGSEAKRNVAHIVDGYFWQYFKKQFWQDFKSGLVINSWIQHWDTHHVWRQGNNVGLHHFYFCFY